MIGRTLWMAVLVALSATSAAAQEIVTDRDDFAQTVTIRFEKPVMVWGGRESGSGQPIIGLDPRVTRTENGTVQHGLVVHYWGPDWMFIGDGSDGSKEPSLIFLLDGDRLPLVPVAGSAVREVGAEGFSLQLAGMRVHEQVYYPIDPESVRTIAEAEEVRLRVYGQDGYVDRSFMDRERDALRRWVQEVIAPEPPATVAPR